MDTHNDGILDLDEAFASIIAKVLHVASLNKIHVT